MKDKILFLLDMEWLHFGIAKSLNDLYECDIFGLVDIDHNSKQFYKTQNIVPFKKYWFYRDFLPNNSRNPDIKFLKKIEEKYDLDLWQIAYSERFFYKYNPFYKFSETEIQSILENETKLFDTILEEINPDFLVTKLTDSHQSELLLRMCKTKKIDVLMMASTRLHNRYTIFNDYDVFDPIEHNTKQHRSIGDLKKIIDKHSKTKILKPSYSKTIPLTTRIKKYFRYLNSLDTTSTNYYAHYGKNKLSVISQFTFFKRLYRQNFINKHLRKHVDTDRPFVYFPLHVEPERQLLMVAPFFDNQIEIIRKVAKSLPIDYRLIVKEHWMMAPRGWRNISFYKKIMTLPNVELVHPSFNGDNLIETCSLVVTISGSTGFEAAVHNKPVITFADNSYTVLPSVHRIKMLEELPRIIKSLLGTGVDHSALDSYVDVIEKNSFEFDLWKLGNDFKEHFSLDLNTVKSNITESKMDSFLTTHHDEFVKLANEHIKKIKQYKQTNN